MDEQRIRQLLAEVRDGQKSAFGELFEYVYSDLRKRLPVYSTQRPGWYALNIEPLVHAVYVDLVKGHEPESWRLPHFKAIVARAMRQVLLDTARKQRASKGGSRRLTFPAVDEADADISAKLRQDWDEWMIAVESSLRELERDDEEACHVFEARFFGQMAIGEIADALSLSESAVETQLRYAQTRLRMQLA